MTQDNPKADSQSPAEALRQQLEELCNKYGYFMGLAYDDTDGIIQTYPQGRVMDELVKFVTAYAATVEREALTDVVVKAVENRTSCSIEIANRLAALQGPQDGDGE